MSEEEIRQLQERLNNITQAISEIRDSIARKVEEEVPTGLKNTIIILGLAALFKKPWLIILAAIPYFLRGEKP